MNSFERSPEGQSNRATFYGVDAVVYVEGGSDIDGHVESYDINFWKKVFQAFHPDKKLRILPRGGKDSLMNLANGVIENDISNVIVAMDRDYDDLFHQIKDDPRIIYSWGYSYENDIFSSDSIKRIFYEFCPFCEGDVDVSQLISDWMKDLISKMRWALRADVCAIANGEKIWIEKSQKNISYLTPTTQPQTSISRKSKAMF